jgi:hypothetical protein
MGNYERLHIDDEFDRRFSANARRGIDGLHLTVEDIRGGPLWRESTLARFGHRKKGAPVWAETGAGTAYSGYRTNGLVMGILPLISRPGKVFLGLLLVKWDPSGDTDPQQLPSPRGILRLLLYRGALTLCVTSLLVVFGSALAWLVGRAAAVF